LPAYISERELLTLVRARHPRDDDEECQRRIVNAIKNRKLSYQWQDAEPGDWVTLTQLKVRIGQLHPGGFTRHTRILQFSRTDAEREWGFHSAALAKTRRVGDAAPAVNPKKRRGPKPGTLDRYGDDDRKLFSEIERVMSQGKISVTAAARKLASEGRVAGTGTVESRARRLAQRFNAEPSKP
jgi:hypothetical protein